MDELIMERANLLDIPKFDPYGEYSLRMYKSGDEIHWQRIHKVADQYTDVTETLFAEQFGDDKSELFRRQIYLQNGDDVIGTASAWHNPEYRDGKFGRIHWVALLPEYQGLGLSNILMTETCRTLADLGYKKAYLTTSKERKAAVYLYEKFGFKEVQP